MYTYGCTLDRVIDGDTMAVSIDLGFRLTAKMPIRLAGINAPEHNTKAGAAATAWAEQWFAAHPGRLTVVTAPAPEKYGRWLGTITADGDPVSINDAALAAGVAAPWIARSVASPPSGAPWSSW